MLTTTGNLLRQTLSIANQITKPLICTTQLRFRKTYRLKTNALGLPPLFLHQQYLEAKEDGSIADFEFEKIRFAQIKESDSVFYDEIFEQFVTFAIKHGNRHTANRISSETLYEIKIIQLNKLRKKQEAERKAADGKVTKKGIDITETQEEIETNPIVILERAIKNIEPVLVTQKVKRGGATYQVPKPIDSKMARTLAFRWVMESVRDRPRPRTKHFPEVMANEILDAFYNRGKLVKRRDDLHRLAHANKAYAHYRWG